MDVGDAFLADLFPNSSSTQSHEGKRFGRDATKVATSHFRVPPHNVDDGIERLALESLKRHPEILVLDHEGQGSSVHVQDHFKLFRHRDVLLFIDAIFERIRIGAVVIRVGVIKTLLVDVPTPTVSRGPHDGRIAVGVNRGANLGHADHGVRAALSSIPFDLPSVYSGGISATSARAVRALRHGMSMNRGGVILFDEHVKGPVVGVPGVLFLRGSVDGLQIEEIVDAMRCRRKSSRFATLLLRVAISGPFAADGVSHERRRSLGLLLTHVGDHGRRAGRCGVRGRHVNPSQLTDG